MDKRTRYCLLLVWTLSALMTVLLQAQNLRLYLQPEPPYGPGFHCTDRLFVTRLHTRAGWESPHSVDVITRINGRQVSDYKEFVAAFEASPLDISYSVERPTFSSLPVGTRSLTIKTRKLALAPIDAVVHLGPILLLTLISLVCSGLLLWKRPASVLTGGTVVLLSAAALWLSADMREYPSDTDYRLLVELTFFMLPASIMHIVARLKERVGGDRSSISRIAAAYVVCLTFWAIMRLWPGENPYINRLTLVIPLLLYMAAAGISRMVAALFSSVDREYKTLVKLFLAATAFALVPGLVALPSGWTSGMPFETQMLSFALLPAALVLVAWEERFFPLDRTLTNLIAFGTLSTLASFVFTLAIGRWLDLREALGTLGEYVLWLMFFLGIPLVVRSVFFVRKLVCRRYFPTRLVYRTITEELARANVFARAREEILRTYEMQLSGRIGVSRWVLFERGSEPGQLDWVATSPDERGALEHVETSLFASWSSDNAAGLLDLPLEVRERLRDRFGGGWELFVPLFSGTEMGALVVVGRKTGASLYSFDDINLLRIITLQTLQALRASRAYHEVTRQRAEVVQLNRDLEGSLETLRAQRTQIEELQNQLKEENLYLREEVGKVFKPERMVAESPGMREVVRLITQAARVDSSVLITGETGSGKELVARAIHNQSRRAGKVLVAVNCAAIPRDLVESELFGHEKGAFTGADRQKRGRFELANQGTLFLDEIGELPLEGQAKLLRVLQEKEIVRVGGETPLRVDARIIAATNRDLLGEVKAGRFREDLYYRLCVVWIHVPSLKERREDLEKLALFFVDKFNQQMGKEVKTISRADLEALRRYDWPGNVRELQNVIERSMVFSHGERLCLSTVAVLGPVAGVSSTEASPGRDGSASLEAPSSVGAPPGQEGSSRTNTTPGPVEAPAREGSSSRVAQPNRGGPLASEPLPTPVAVRTATPVSGQELSPGPAPWSTPGLPPIPEDKGLSEHLEMLRGAYLEQALEGFGGSSSKAARRLGMTQSNFARALKRARGT